MHNFWKTWEVHCWSAGLLYDQYKAEHPGPYKPLCYEAFMHLCETLEIQMENDNG